MAGVSEGYPLAQSGHTPPPRANDESSYWSCPTCHSGHADHRPYFTQLTFLIDSCQPRPCLLSHAGGRLTIFVLAEFISCRPSPIISTRGASTQSRLYPPHPSACQGHIKLAFQHSSACRPTHDLPGCPREQPLLRSPLHLHRHPHLNLRSRRFPTLMARAMLRSRRPPRQRFRQLLRRARSS